MALKPKDDGLARYRKAVGECIHDNLSSDALWGLGMGTLGGAWRGARLGAAAGAPFEGVGAVPGAIFGGLAGGAIGAANGGLLGMADTVGHCAVLPNGARIDRR